MTKEEAIDILQNTSFFGRTVDDIDTAIQMATKALEQEPCDDVISRQAVLNLAKKGILISNGNFESVCKAINELPSVNSTKTGHWIDEFGGCECSECGCLEGGYSDYCPNCGARMIEPQERSGEE